MMATDASFIKTYLARVADEMAAERGVVRRGDVLLAATTDEFYIRFGRDQMAMPPNIVRCYVDCTTARDAAVDAHRLSCASIAGVFDWCCQQVLKGNFVSTDETDLVKVPQGGRK